MTDHESALNAAIVAAGFDPRNPAVLKAWQAGIAKYLEERNSEAAGVVCLGCGSNWTNERLSEERSKRPELISCCPERKTVSVFAAPSADTDSEIIEAILAGQAFVFDPATNFVHADDGGAPEFGIKYVPAPYAGGETVKALEAAYTAGFNASAQGWNGEHGCDTETDSCFLEKRDDYVRSLRSGHEWKNL